MIGTSGVLGAIEREIPLFLLLMACTITGDFVQCNIFLRFDARLASLPPISGSAQARERGGALRSKAESLFMATADRVNQRKQSSTCIRRRASSPKLQPARLAFP
jgi:hypothetical protein